MTQQKNRKTARVLLALGAPLVVARPGCPWAGRAARRGQTTSAALLDRVRLRPGHSVIDLGCGPRGILDLLAERVSPAGRVACLDADPAHTVMAAEFAARPGPSGVQIITADARSTGLAAGSFDLVHARTLLINHPDRAGVAAEMMRLARPGSWVASLEPDIEYARATRLTRPPTGPVRSSPKPSAATAPIRGSGAGCRNCSASRDSTTSMRRPGWRCTRRAIPAGPSALTWCAASGRTCWRWA